MYKFEFAKTQLIEIGRQLHAKNMIPAASGNFSARLDDGNFALTESGCHKGHLDKGNILQVDAYGESLDHKKVSAETSLHMQIFQYFPTASVIIHPHSVNSTVLSKCFSDKLILKDYELLKAFSAIHTHTAEVSIPIIENSQDIQSLCAILAETLRSCSKIPAYLIRGHGYFTWGSSFSETMRHVEALEYFFACELLLNK